MQWDIAARNAFLEINIRTFAVTVSQTCPRHDESKNEIRRKRNKPGPRQAQNVARVAVVVELANNEAAVTSENKKLRAAGAAAPGADRYV